jgi:hypothetical protein
MNRLTISKKHALHDEFMRAFRDAIFVKDAEDIERIKQVYGENADDLLHYKFDSIRRHVRRLIPPPDILKVRLEECFAYYRGQMDPETNLPLFTSQTEKDIRNLFKHLKCLSDGNAVLYYKIGETKSGLPIYHCLRGTSVTESVHSKLRSRFASFNAGGLSLLPSL